jgi:hypothetical protein
LCEAEYDGNTYKDVLKILANVTVGTPSLGTAEVRRSTFHEIRAVKPVAA